MILILEFSRQHVSASYIKTVGDLKNLKTNKANKNKNQCTIIWSRKIKHTYSLYIFIHRHCYFHLICILHAQNNVGACTNTFMHSKCPILARWYSKDLAACFLTHKLPITHTFAPQPQPPPPPPPHPTSTQIDSHAYTQSLPHLHLMPKKKRKKKNVKQTKKQKKKKRRNKNNKKEESSNT